MAVRIDQTLYLIITALLVLGVLVGISMMSKVKTARAGNALSALCSVIAILVTMNQNAVLDAPVIWAAILVGAVISLICAAKVKMIQMPQVVAFLNGLGGISSALVAILSVLQAEDTASRYIAVLALVIGFVTFTGSMVAAGKLAKLLNQRPVIWKNHSAIVNGTLIATLAAGVLGVILDSSLLYVITALLACFFGVAFSIRVGGADMPITISLLNSLSGVAGGIAGIAVGDLMLVAVGGIVGASGLLLTQVMCRAMNRKLSGILLGTAGKKTTGIGQQATGKGQQATGNGQQATGNGQQAVGGGVPDAPQAAKTDTPAVAESPSVGDGSPVPPSPAGAADPDWHSQRSEESVTPGAILAAAKKVMIVPGYGMALAQAQHLVKQLADKLEARGCEVKFAIHPVAGRMPGHMNVLLCEVDVPYDQLYEMDDVNDEFKDCDAAVIIGASDVVNPAANTAEGTPIYGMPVLRAEEAKHIIVCNYDDKPGYAGVPNPIYKQENTIMLLGDAKDSLTKLLAQMDEADRPAAPAAASSSSVGDGSPVPPSPVRADAHIGPAAPDCHSEHSEESVTPGSILAAAKKVMIVPGYGMALAQAQRLVKQLADKLEAKGCEVKFAIHPVAGRMPGHMNVLLCEVDVPYDQLYEMDDINDEFKDCDAAVIIGASDVVNPAANTAEGTPIYGMPVLRAEEAKHIIVCNYDDKPGYAGVPNPLYTQANTVMLLGDAKDSLNKLLNSF